MLKKPLPSSASAKLALRLGCKDGIRPFAESMRGDRPDAAFFVASELGGLSARPTGV
jgi:hypothetical protein